MAVYLVTWDLNQEKPNYGQARLAFVSHLEQLDNTKDPGLDSVRFVSTSSSVDQIYNFLGQKLDKSDRLMIVKLEQSSYNGWISKETGRWINDRM